MVVARGKELYCGRRLSRRVSTTTPNVTFADGAMRGTDELIRPHTQTPRPRRGGNTQQNQHSRKTKPRRTHKNTELNLLTLVARTERKGGGGVVVSVSSNTGHDFRFGDFPLLANRRNNGGGVQATTNESKTPQRFGRRRTSRRKVERRLSCLRVSKNQISAKEGKIGAPFVGFGRVVVRDSKRKVESEDDESHACVPLSLFCFARARLCQREYSRPPVLPRVVSRVTGKKSSCLSLRETAPSLLSSLLVIVRRVAWGNKGVKRRGKTHRG